MRETLRAALVIAGKDLRAELRRRTALVSALLFAALMLTIFEFGRDPAALPSRVLAPSALWITCTFAAMTALSRAFALELESAALDGLLMAPLPREAVFLGKFLGNLAFVGIVEAVTLPLFVLFFNVAIGGALAGLVVLTVLATVGFVAVGTVFGALTARLRAAELLLPLLLLPFLLAPIVAAVQGTAALLAGRSLSDAAGWVRLLLVYDIVFITGSLLVFPAVVDE